MKYICILLLCGCVIIGGRVFALKYSARERMSESFLSFLVFAKNEVNFTSGTVLEIVQKYVRLYPHTLPFLEKCEEPLGKSVHHGLAKNTALSREQKVHIEQFFDVFGMGDELSSINLLEHTMVSFRELNRREREENQKKIHLIHRLSVLLAAGIAILLI